jgi:membrane protease YdiL (CAAX protease family)
MIACQAFFGLTIGGGGRLLMNAASLAQNADPLQYNNAVNAAVIRIAEFAEKNVALILSISALLSILIYMKIFSLRKLNLLSIMNLDRKPYGNDIRYGVFAGASANIILSIAVAVLQGFNLFDRAFADYNTRMDAMFSSGSMLALLLGIGLIGPFAEEILFRGIIKFELDRVMPKKAAIVAQGVLFGLYHMEPVQIIYTIPIGIYLGYITYKTGSVWPAAAGHIAMNSVSILLAAPALAAIIDVPQFSLFVIVLSAYMFFSALRYFLKKTPGFISLD